MHRESRTLSSSKRARPTTGQPFHLATETQGPCAVPSLCHLGPEALSPICILLIYCTPCELSQTPHGIRWGMH